MTDETMSRASVREDRPPARGGAHLLVALECDRPLAPPSRHALAGVTEVVIGRGPRGARRRDEGGVRRLAIAVPDAMMSGEHARLVRLRDRWIFEDSGSKNGAQVNGAAVKRAVLLDGDLLELGRTLLRFRAEAQVAAPEVLDLDAAALPAGRETFLGPLAQDFDALARVAPSAVPVTLVGDTGSGKEVAARALHDLSRRRGAFVAVNCGAIPAALVEATLFGHRKGAFTGAVDDGPGLIRSAAAGTLFLDEVGSLGAAAQVALLRALQEREVVPVGEARPVAVDFRVVAATHRPLAELAQAAGFRRDLQARLEGLTVTLPPLRERLDDLGLLIGLLLRRGAGARPIHVAAARALFRHDWPLNIRELEHALATAAALAGDGPIRLEHLPAAIRGEGGAPDRVRDELVALLTQERGNIAGVARLMGKGRMQIHRWLKRFALDAKSFRT